MYERFTDRARKVMQLANQEAQRFNHDHIGTEHILLGLVKEGSGVAANVLKNLDIDLRKIRLEVEKIVQAGPDMVTTGKLPQTPRADKVIEYAIEEADNLNHSYVGTEHLLLGLLREQEGVADQVLMNLGLRLGDVREETLNLLGVHGALDRDSARTPAATGPPADTQQAIAELDAEIERVNQEKEAAVAQQDFEKAAQLRDRVANLKKRGHFSKGPTQARRAVPRERSSMTSAKQPDNSYLVLLLHRSHAQALRSRQPWIGTGHILLEMLKTSSSEIGNYFNQRTVDLKLVESVIKHAPHSTKDWVDTCFRSRLLRWPPLLRVPHLSYSVHYPSVRNSFTVTPSAQDVLNQSQSIAQQLNHDAVNSVHVLRAILETTDSVAAQVLSRLFSGTDPLLHFVNELLTPASAVESTVKPKELFEHLSNCVVDQPTALEEIASAVALHSASAAAPHRQKLNLLLCGPTGVGKTFAIEKLAQHLRVKVGFLSCAATTAPGYVGGDIESALWDLYVQ
jgi:ATP-dependent Clp protease ATP-binding subunit ClpA